MSVGISTNFAKVIRNDYDTVGNNNTPLSKLSLLTTQRKFNKQTKEWETLGTTFFDAVVWGDKATEIALVEEGAVLDLSAQIKEGENGPYVSFRAFIEDNKYTNKEGKEVATKQVTIRDWEIRTFDND